LLHDYTFDITLVQYDKDRQIVQFVVQADPSNCFESATSGRSSIEISVEKVQKLILDDVAKIETHSINYIERAADCVDVVGNTDFNFKLYGESLLFNMRFRL